MRISPEIRSMIAQLDELAGNIKDYFDIDFDHSVPETHEFRDILEELQDKITILQEDQGWLDDDPEQGMMPGPGGKPFVYDDLTPEIIKDILKHEIYNKVSRLNEIYHDNTHTIFEFGNLDITQFSGEDINCCNAVITDIAQKGLDMNDRVQLTASIYYSLGCMIITFDDKEKVRIPID